MKRFSYTWGRRHSQNRINTTINTTLKQMRKPRFLFLICVNCVQILPAQHNNNTQFKICIDRCFCFPLFEKIDNRIIYNLGKCVSSKQQYNANSLKTKCKSHSLIVHPLRLATRKHALDAARH